MMLKNAVVITLVILYFFFAANADFSPLLSSLFSLLSSLAVLLTRIDPKAFARKRKGGKKRGRRRSVVCSTSTQKLDKNWMPKKVAKTEEQRANIMSVISENILFSTLNDSEKYLVADVMVEKKYNAGDVIIKQGDDGDNFYVVASGSIPISIEGVGQVYESQVGDAFGELALLYDAPRAATCVAGANGAVCWALDRDSFKHMMYKATVEKREQNHDFLKSVKILSSLNDYERGRLSDALNEQVVKAGEVVVQEGDAGDDFYIIQSGEFKVNIDGVEKEVSKRLTKGSYFGEVALLLSQPRSATVTAVTDGTLLSVHRDSFSKLLGNLKDILGRNMELYNEFTSKASSSKKK